MKLRVCSNDPKKILQSLNGFDTKTDGKIGKRQKILRFLGLLPKIGNAKYLEWGHGTPHWEGEVLKELEIVMF